MPGSLAAGWATGTLVTLQIGNHPSPNTPTPTLFLSFARLPFFRLTHFNFIFARFRPSGALSVFLCEQPLLGFVAGDVLWEGDLYYTPSDIVPPSSFLLFECLPRA